MTKFIVQLLLSFVIAMPVWIYGVSVRHWRQLLKKIVITAMTLTSTCFTIYLILKPPVNPTTFSIWVTNISIALYFFACIISAYFSWPSSDKAIFHLKDTVLMRRWDKYISSKRHQSLSQKTFISIPHIVGADDNVLVEFINATFQQKNTVTKKYPDPDFGAWLIEEIYNQRKIFAEKRGFKKKILLCPFCNTELNNDSPIPRMIENDFKYKDFSPFAMRITLPAIECPRCKKVCVADSSGLLSYHLNEAIIRAFKSENIKS